MKHARSEDTNQTAFLRSRDARQQRGRDRAHGQAHRSADLRSGAASDAKGNALPVTVLEAGPCPVVQVKDAKKDGYSALQIAFGEAKLKNTSNAMKGHFAKAKAAPSRMLREVRLDGEATHEVGQSLT